MVGPNVSINGRAHANGSSYDTGINVVIHEGVGAGTLACADPNALKGGGVLSAHFGVESVEVSADGSEVTIATTPFDMPADHLRSCTAVIVATKAGPHGSGACEVFNAAGDLIYDMALVPFENIVDRVTF